MTCPTSSHCLCCSTVIITFHARRRSTMYAFQGNDRMPQPTSSDRVCCPRAMMACHARCCPTMCFYLWRYWHGTSHVVRSCVLNKSNDVMPHPTSSIRVCIPMAIIACHVNVVPQSVLSQGVYAMTSPISFDHVLSNGNDNMPCVT